ncbi:MAG: hypothetical protein COA78_36760 [Blastopirellula sp.]|nr:MAG: hypothetical protein COA78_36760 [Blastopirellula sp.]
MTVNNNVKHKCIETEGFKFKGRIFNYQNSNEIMTNGQAPQLVVSGVKAIHTECKVCEHSWIAKADNGTYHPAAGGGYVTCPSPSCENEGCIPSSLIRG